MNTLGLTTRIELRDGVVTVYDHLGRVAATMSGPVATVHLGAIDSDVLLVGVTAPGAVVHLPPDPEPERAHVELDEIERDIEALLSLDSTDAPTTTASTVDTDDEIEELLRSCSS